MIRCPLAPTRPPGHTAGMDVIAEYPLRLKYPDGEMAQVRLRINRPVELTAGKWNCEAEIEMVGRLRIDALQEGPVPLKGTGDTSWRAMIVAIRFLYYSMLLEVRSTGAALYDDSGQRPVHLNDVFPVPMK